MFTIWYIRGKKALSIFPDINSQDVKFRDKAASGYSAKSRITKMGGAGKALDLVVTENELWLKSTMIAASILGRYDLLHKISLNKITNIAKRGNEIIVDFKTEYGEDKQVVIITKRPDDFLNAIKKNNCV